MTTLRQYKPLPPLSDLNPGYDAGWRFDVIILQAEAVDKTSGGIMLPDSIKDDERAAAVEALIVDISPTAFKHSDWVATNLSRPYEPGDVVLTKRYPPGVRFKGADGREYMMVADEEIRGRSHRSSSGAEAKAA